jgi:hypothetical protein
MFTQIKSKTKINKKKWHLSLPSIVLKPLMLPRKEILKFPL